MNTEPKIRTRSRPKAKNIRPINTTKTSKTGIAQRKAMVLEILEKNMGLVSPTMKRLGMSREVYYKWRREDPEFKRRTEEIREVVVDFGETCLMQQMKEGSVQAILGFLKAKGRDRGYGDQVALSHSGPNGAPIQHEVIEKPTPQALYSDMEAIVNRRKRLENGDFN